MNGPALPDPASFIHAAGLWWGERWHLAALVASSALPSLNLAGTTSFNETDPHQGRVLGEFNVITVWLVLCGYDAGSTDCVMLSRQGGLLDSFVTERLQVQSKQEPESFSFFFASEPHSEMKPAVHE